MSPNLADVEFFPGGVRTRPGLVSQFAALSGAVKINGLKTYVTANLLNRLLVFDSLGNLYTETTPGTLRPRRHRRHAKSLPRLHHALWPRIHGFQRFAPRPGSSAPIRRHLLRSRQPDRPRRRPRSRRRHHRRQHLRRRSSSQRSLRHAPGLLDRAIPAGKLDRRGRQAGHAHEYSHGPVKHRPAIALLHGRRRGEFLPSSRRR